MPSAAFRFRPASAALLLALGLGATCCGTAVQAQGAWASGLDEQDALPGSASALPAGVRRLPDVPYGPDARQRIDVYLPAHPHPGRAPMLVFVHGGAWMAGDRVRAARLPAKLTHWVAERGWVVVSVGYRLVPRVTVADQLQDVAAALARAQRGAAGWGADPDRVLLMGHSAGAHLAALLAAQPSAFRAMGVRRWRGTVLLDSAALDLPAVMAQRHWRFYDRVFGADPRDWQALSPADRLAPGASPMLLVCSTVRPDAPCRDARRMAEAAQTRGVRTEVLPQPLSHRDINALLGLPGPYTEAVDRFAASLGLR